MHKKMRGNSGLALFYGVLPMASWPVFSNIDLLDVKSIGIASTGEDDCYERIRATQRLRVTMSYMFDKNIHLAEKPLDYSYLLLSRKFSAWRSRKV